MPGNMGSNWFNAVKQQISLGTSQKCGFGTFNLGKYDYGILKRPLPMFDERYWFVREPVSRFKSFYKHIVRGQAFDRLNWLGKQLSSPEEVIEFIETHLTDADNHWKPQAWILDGVRTELVPLHHLGEVFGAERQHITHSEDVILSPGVIQKILDIYADDVILYELALKTDCSNLPKIKRDKT